ncbi:MAG: dienelactone hydrolase family protein [Candidatus Sericytochromatia bacterium]|nr:dienelactone hydrolase family protein [Candidatus Sericytochromatia bacterium]
MALVTKDVTLQVSDGTSMGAYLARPEGAGPFPGVLVFQEIWGVNPHIRSVADRLAERGYIALAPELFHRTAPGFQAPYTDPDPGYNHMQQMTGAGITADLKAAYDWLMVDPICDGDRIGTLGFCLGGRVALMANLLLPIQASVSFYGGGIAQTLIGQLATLHAPALFFWAGNDAHIPPTDVQAVLDALRQADKDYVSTEFAKVGHGFFCDERASYDAAAASQAWALAQAFFSSHLSR